MRSDDSKNIIVRLVAYVINRATHLSKEKVC